MRKSSMRILKKVVGVLAPAALVLGALSLRGDSISVCAEPRRPAAKRKPLPGPEERAMLPKDGGKEFNRLIHEKSPYLLQHARNPVDWYPWGKEALEKAKREKKPIFVSIGYSTCHWCHVMEHESFEREDVAEILNKHFVAIKIDREERPDLDSTYMLATQLMVGRGGWPNSVWLRPDGKPWYAGTYFPREDHRGRPGFKSVLKRLAKTWKDRRKDVDKQAESLWAAMKRASSGRSLPGGGELSRDLVAGALKGLRGRFDEKLGGFGRAPKFPPHMSLTLLLYEYERSRDVSALKMARRTLDAMAAGGIRDHVGGGFHRYSTDARWLVPHFEKMLYDNAQLSRAYVDAWRLTKDQRYRQVAVETFEWVLREMTDPGGAFYSALDADSDGEEGKFYVWKRPELLRILGKEDGELFARVYGVNKGGNWVDEAAGHKPGTNILHLPRPLAAVAGAEKMELAELEKRLSAARGKLLVEREKRVRPHRDDKVLTAWNGLMIGALAHGGRHFKEKKYVEAAEKAADFILKKMRRKGRLLRTYREKTARLNAYLVDYVFMAGGLLDLYEATGEKRWLKESRALVEVMLKHYADGVGGFYFTSNDHGGLALRTRDPFDRAIPSGNGAAAQVLVRLAVLSGEKRYRAEARKVAEAFLGFARRTPTGTQSLITAVAMYFDTGGEKPAGGALARARRKPVTVEVSSSSAASPGGEFVLTVRISMDAPYHINSAKPLQKYLSPTEVSLEGGKVFKPGKVVYPDGKKVKLGFSREELSVYESKVAIKVPVRVAAGAEPGSMELKLTVRFQACSDRECLAPEKVELTVPIKVVKPG